MVTRLRSLLQVRAHRAARRIPEGYRVYAVGDIHGRADLLEELHSRICADIETHTPEHSIVVYLGDYIDRGLESSKVIEMLSGDGLSADCEQVFLKGNHEFVMLQFLDDSRFGADWMAFGGDATAYSYGLRMKTTTPDDGELAEMRDSLLRHLPAHHLEFLQRLQISYTIGGYYFVHAGVLPHVHLDQQAEHDLLWIRDEFTTSSLEHGARIVHGHSVAFQMEVLPNRIGIDTGAYATGCLTALVLEGGSVSSLSTA